MANGIPVTITRATQELQKYRTGLKVMSGGFTLSGGEPLMQDRFTVKLLAAAREMGIHTALDTNGSLGERVSDDELKNIDLVLLDIKGWDSERHRQLTGNDISPVLNFARRLAARNRPMWVRFVLVPGLTDDLGDIAHIARFAASLGSVVQRVQVLPFHQMGKYKWKALNLDYNLESVSTPSIEQVESVTAEFRALGLQTD
jgi:pyruvate formate lyase activating enzyme